MQFDLLATGLKQVGLDQVENQHESACDDVWYSAHRQQGDVVILDQLTAALRTYLPEKKQELIERQQQKQNKYLQKHFRKGKQREVQNMKEEVSVALLLKHSSLQQA